MCGIAGIISPNNNNVQQSLLQTMADVLKHRGPDGEGFWINNDHTIGLAHRRLAVIDLSDAGGQPMHYLHYTIVFNGEIYNYRELKDTLHSKGYRFTSQTDTEVIMAAYDCWGIECLDQFDGMFAFALWNEQAQQLIIARDRFGEKPLYYYAGYVQRGTFEKFLFASEMKALWAAGVPKNLDGTMMLNYLSLGYTQNPLKKTATFFSNILSLPAGHYLQVFPKDGRVQMKKWYKLKAETLVAGNDAIESTFRQLFFESVERRLRSDVNIGTSLSGGVDSAAILAAIDHTKNKNSNWKNIAFTASFPGFEKDETAYARIVAGHFGIRQHIIEPGAKDWATYFEKLMYHQEEPLQSSSVLTQFLIYKTAKENNITVLLDGQGADEMLAGYKKYAHWYLQQLFIKDTSLYFKERKLLEQHDFLETWGWRNYAAAMFPDKAAGALQSKAAKHQENNAYINRDFYYNYRNIDTLQKPVTKQLEDILYYNTFTTGLPELLRYADRNSMANSVEVRLPFLSNALATFIFSLPARYKIRDGFTKWILRKSMDGFLPDAVLYRKGKTGFEPPQQQWMQDDHVQQMIIAARETLVSKKVLQPAILATPVKPGAAHDADNYDWRYLCASAVFA